MTRLTVPTAGTTPGRAANLQVVDPGFGQAVSDIGQAALQIGTQLENDRLSREAQRFQVDIARDFNNLRLEVDQIGDPDQLDRVWEQRTAELRQRYFDGQSEDGRPLVDPKNRDRATLAFDELQNRHAFSVGVRAIEARQSQSEANWLAYQHEAGLTVANSPDPQTRGVVTAQANDMLADMVERGIITPEEAQRRSLALGGDLVNATAIRQVNDDPEGFLAASDAGEFNALGAEAVARYQLQAQAAIDRRAADEARAAEKAQSDAQAAIGDRLSEMQQIFDADRVPVDAGFMSLPEVKAHPEYARTQAALDLAQERADLPRMRPQDIEALIADEQGRTVAYAYQAERLELLQGQLDAVRTGWRTDPIAYAATAAFDIPELPAFDPANPAAFAAGLRKRQVATNALTEQGYPAGARILTEAERDQVRALASVDADPAARVDFAAAALPYLQGNSADSASALIDDPVFLHVGAQVASGQISRNVAEATFRGQQVMAQNNVILPPIADRTGAAFETVQSIFADLPGGERLQSGIVAAADALYASKIRSIDPAADIDDDLYRQSLHEVMGGSGVYDSRHAMGGVQEINGRATVLPRGVNAAAVSQAIAGLGRTTVAGTDAPARADQQRGGVRAAIDQEALVRRLSAMSTTGRPPAGATDPGFLEELQDLELRAIGPDAYVFVFDSAAGPRSLSDANGQEYRFSLTRLLTLVQP